MSLDRLTDCDKIWKNPESNILSVGPAVLNDPENMQVWVRYLIAKKNRLSAEGKSSFVECITDYSGMHPIDGLEMLCSWDQKLIGLLAQHGLSVRFSSQVTAVLPQITSVYVMISR